MLAYLVLPTLLPKGSHCSLVKEVDCGTFTATRCSQARLFRLPPQGAIPPIQEMNTGYELREGRSCLYWRPRRQAVRRELASPARSIERDDQARHSSTPRLASRCP